MKYVNLTGVRLDGPLGQESPKQTVHVAVLFVIGVICGVIGAMAVGCE